MKLAQAPFFRRTMADEIPWVGCQFPTNAYAQEAGMPLGAFEDFFYGACLRDWDAEGERMRRYCERFDAADEVRIVGAETDLPLSLQGRKGEVDDGHVNVPGGEFFFSPNEDSAEGTILLRRPDRARQRAGVRDPPDVPQGPRGGGIGRGGRGRAPGGARH